jgi:Tfp pilus assembly protein PilF
MGVTLPVVIFAYLWIVRKEKNLVKNLIKLSGYIVLLIAVFIYKVFVLEPEAPLTVEISYIIKTFGEYVQILLFPFNLCAERNLGKVMSFFEPTFLLGIFSLIIITLIFVYIKNLRFPLAFFMITILPVLNIIYLVGRPLAEQRMYIPSLGFCMVLGYIFDRMWEEKLTQKIFVLLVALYAIVAIDRNFDWRDPVTFWEKTLYQTGSPRAFLNLGEAYLSIGDNELGIRVSKQALRYDPSFVGALANIGIGYMKLGEKEKALEYFYKSLMMQPYDANNYVNFAVALLEQGHLEEAKKILEKGLQLDDKNALLHYTLGNVYAQLKQFDKAAEHFKMALFLNPELKIAERNYKQALLDMQRIQQKSN